MFLRINIDLSEELISISDNNEKPSFILNLDGFEGPLDVLLVMSRAQKVDLTKISILQLAEQYIEFIERARELQLEVAADYLVMAAWLAYMKSKLLLPSENLDEEPTGEEMAAVLAHRLQKLNAMRESAGKLLDLPREGYEIFSRGDMEGVNIVRVPIYDASLFDLLMAYAAQDARVEAEKLVIDPPQLFSMEDAYQRLSSILGKMPDWESLSSMIPAGSEKNPLLLRSAIASTFAASLELVREGKIYIRQSSPFSAIYVRGVGGKNE